MSRSKPKTSSTSERKRRLADAAELLGHGPQHSPSIADLANRAQTTGNSRAVPAASRREYSQLAAGTDANVGEYVQVSDETNDSLMPVRVTQQEGRVLVLLATPSPADLRIRMTSDSLSRATRPCSAGRPRLLEDFVHKPARSDP
jgi:hypothetical protein